MTDDAITEKAARRERRRAARQRKIDTSIASPCISVCQLDDATGFCLGCFRDVDEIREWPIMTADEKTQVLTDIAGRKASA